MKKTPASYNKQSNENSTPHLSSKKSTAKKTQPINKPVSMEEFKEIPQETSLNINNEDLPTNGESVLVAVRVRPMNSTELSRGDEYCIKLFNDHELQIHEKGTQKLYQYNAVLPEVTKQDEVYNRCSITVILSLRSLIDDRVIGPVIFSFGRVFCYYFCLRTDGEWENIHVWSLAFFYELE